MRLPRESQLSAEQKEICLAPTDGTMLVVGPPGSGKTVVAVYRIQALKKRRQPTQLIVFNHVLRSYMGDGETGLLWLSNWWRKATRSRFPYTIREPEDGNGRRQGEYDYSRAAEAVRGPEKGAILRNGNWGHLVLDEAQDFPPEMHSLLSLVQKVVFKDVPPKHKPTLLVLADENQRLTSHNSKIDEIRTAHMLTRAETYELCKNYRNTLEIARFAEHFCVGLESGVAEQPDRRGPRPIIAVTGDVNEAVKRIETYARINEDEDIGVFVNYDNTRRKLFNKLDYRLGDSSLRVQTYTSKRGRGGKKVSDNDAGRLVFDEAGSITVLCFASGKGLEFDAVFLPELQTMPVDAENKDPARMCLYVMCSRAREKLFVLISDPEGEAAVWSLLPSRSSGLFDRED